MYIPDLEPCRSSSAPFHADLWSAPLLAVGWLEQPHAFARGFAPDGLYTQLETFVEHAQTYFEQYHSRGLHVCSLCKSKTREAKLTPFGFFNLLVPGAGVIYAAPATILHYIKAHYYLPPKEFMNAVRTCPPYGSNQFMEALKRANRDVPPPIENYQDYLRSFREAVAAAEKRKQEGD